jgi:chromosome partitioning protein
VARNLATAAALDGISLATADLDPQRTFSNWYSRRNEGATTWPHYPADMSDAEELATADLGVELLIIDTAPSIEMAPAGGCHLVMGDTI